MDSTSGVWYDLKCFTLATSLPNGGVRDFLEKFKAPAILIAELLKLFLKIQISSQHLPAQSQEWRYRDIMWNLFRGNKKKARNTSVMSFWCLWFYTLLSCFCCWLLEDSGMVQLITCEFCQRVKNTCFEEHPWLTASVIGHKNQECVRKVIL